MPGAPGAPGGAPGGGKPPAGGPPVPGGAGAGLPPPPSASLKGMRDKIASIVNKIRGKRIEENTGDTTRKITAEEVGELLKQGQVEFMKEVKSAIGWFPELKDVFDENLFVGVEKKAEKKENKFGVLLNSDIDEENEFFMKTINTIPFDKGFNKNTNFIYGEKISSELSLFANKIEQKISTGIKQNSDIEDTSDFVVTLRNVFTDAIKEAMHEVYHTGKLHTYGKTNYIAHKNFLKRQYNDSSANLTSDGFVDTIVVEENLMLFEYILTSMVQELTKGKALDEISTGEITRLINLLLKILLFQMLVVGQLRGYEEQGFQEVVILPCNPDLLSTEINGSKESIAEIFALGEGGFQKLYRTSTLFDVVPVYGEGVNLVEGFNDRISYKVGKTDLLNVPVLYSDFLTKFTSNFNLKFSAITFVNNPSEIPDLNKLITEAIKVDEPQLKMALYQKELHRISQEIVFKIDDKLYVAMDQMKDDFRKVFISSIYNDLNKESALLSKKIGADVYNIPEEQFKKLLDAKVLINENEVYKFSTTKLPSSSYSKDLIGLINLMADFNLHDDFLWDKTGKLISNFSLMLNEDYFKVALPVYFNNPDFLKRYYPSHYKVLSSLK